MGRIIDRLTLAWLGLSGAYLLFVNAWHSVPLALTLTLACGGCALLLSRALPARPRHASAWQAKRHVLEIASMETSDAVAALEPLLRRHWPGEAFALQPVLKHPSASLSANDVLVLWKAHRGGMPLLIAATCPADSQARSYAATLRDPRVAIVDQGQLTRLLSREPTSRSALTQPSWRALRDRLARALSRPSRPGLLPMGLGLLGLYLATGKAVYLAGGLWIALRCGMRWLGQQPQARLFP